MTTPIFVTNFNNLDRGFLDLVHWLEDDIESVTVIDNASTWQPLLDYYYSHDELRVIRNKENLGPYAFWELGLHRQQKERFIVTDPDVVPAGYCLSALRTISQMESVMSLHNASKVGPSLRIDNLPDHFRYKQDVLKWEQQFWDRPVFDWVVTTSKNPVYHADIDTTFAMYEPGSEVRNAKPCLRLAPPYCFEHVPWYEDSAAPNAERDYYLAHARKDWIHW